MKTATKQMVGLLGITLAISIAGCASPQVELSDSPSTPFKLATFEVNERVLIGLVLDQRILDIAEANEYLASETNANDVSIPVDMRTLIETYEIVSPRLYEIANFFSEYSTDSLDFAFDVSNVYIHAPIKYPWNLLAVAANYKAHAEGMGVGGTSGAAESVDGTSGATESDESLSIVDRIVPERDAPAIFAKSSRSGIIDPGAPYYIPPGRDRIDWEGELAIIIGKPAYLLSPEEAHDHVFGYSILYDVSDRGGRTREVSMFPGFQWFDGKSTNRGAPFGPFIVPKEFLPNFDNLRVVTRVNGDIKQDQTTADLIWNEDNLIAFTTSVLELHPGDVIATGSPSGTAGEHDPAVYLKDGDVVEIEIEGIGTLVTPIKNYPGDLETS